MATPSPGDIPDIETVYPWLEDGLEFLLAKKAVSAKQYAALSQADKLRTIGSASIATARKAAELRRHLADAVKAGDDEAQFRERIENAVGLQRTEANKILRTVTKQAYTDGMTRTLEKPHIAKAFPYAMYVATRDGRTRPEHAALDGKITEVGSAEYQHWKDELAAWQCRCSLIPLSAKQAAARGVSVPSSLVDAAVAEPVAA